MCVYVHACVEAHTYATGPARTGHICTNYTCSENGSFLGLCLRYSYSVTFIYFLIDL